MSHMYRYKPTHTHTLLETSRNSHLRKWLEQLANMSPSPGSNFMLYPVRAPHAARFCLRAFVITHTAAECDIRPHSFSYDSYMRVNHSTAGGCWLQWHFGKKIPEPVVDCAVVSCMSARVDSLGNAGNAKPFLGLLPRQQAMHGRRKMLWEKKDEESMEELWHS